MEKQMIFHILGIAETRDESAIKAAYLNLLRSTNPEDDPEGFKRLRQAYEGAVALAREALPQEDDPETPYDLWVGEVDRIYEDIRLRADPAAWKEVLSDPICDDLDTSLQAREALLVFLMDHIYLPRSVWQLIDRTFQIQADRQNLLNQFPENFLDYVIYYTQNEEFIDFDLFEITGDEPDADAYIRTYLDLKHQLDQGLPADASARSAWLEQWDGLRAFGVYHPFQDCEYLRFCGAAVSDGEADQPSTAQETADRTGTAQETTDRTGTTQEAADKTGTAQETADRLRAMQDIADRLCAMDYQNHYIRYYCGDAYWNLGRKEDAFRLWSRILSDYPDHYMAKYSIIRYLMEKGDYRQAKEYLLDLLDVNGSDEDLLNDMRTANAHLMEEYSALIADPEKADERQANTMELAWCLFQNEKPEEAISLLESFEPEEEQLYSYENLYGRVLYREERYPEALVHLLRWLELIKATRDDGTQEMKKRISRRFRACHILSGCFHGIGDQEQALSYVEQAIEAAENWTDRLSAMQYKAYLLFQYEQYEACIDVCDQTVAADSEYYPAYLQRMEAAFRLQKGQQVVDDFYRATDLYAGYYKPYLLAAQIFFYHSQFTDAKGVFARARENGVPFTPNMMLFEEKVLRNLADSSEAREDLFKQLAKLQKLWEEDKEQKQAETASGRTLKKEESDTPKFDIEDPSEIEFELGLLEWDNHHLDDALAHLTTAIGQNPERLQYRLIRGHIYLDKGSYQKALEEYGAAADDYENTPTLSYSRAQCYEGLNMKELARECLEKTLKLQEGFRDACWKLSGYYKERYLSGCDPKDFKKAEEYINRQLAAEESCYYLVERGRLYMASFDLKAAIADFEKALTLDPKDWAACNNLGCCYKYLGDFPKAIECLEKAVLFLGEEKNVLPYSNMADCYEALGDYRKAIWCYEQDLKAFPHQMFLYEEVGLLYSYLEEYDKALEYLSKAPDRDDYCENTALIHFLTGNKRKAIHFYERQLNAATEKNDKADLLYAMGSFYSDYLNDLPKALACYKRGLLLSDRENRLMDLEWRASMTLFRMGRRADAKNHAAKALEHFAKEECGVEEYYLGYRQFRPARLLRFGWLRICLGEPEEGLRLLREMTACSRCRMCRRAGCFESYLFLGLYYEAIGDNTEALRLYRQAEALNPQEKSIAIAAARVEGRAGRR